MARAAFTRTAVGRMLDASPQPAYLLDEKRRMVYANPALAEWLGVELESLFKLRCDYHSDGGQRLDGLSADQATNVDGGGSADLSDHEDPNSLVAILCPPPATLDGVSMQSIVRGCSTRNERSDVWQVSHCPLRGENGELQGVLSIFEADFSESTSSDLSRSGRPPIDIDGNENTPAALHDAISRMRKKHHEMFQIGGLVGNSAAMERVRNRIALVSSPEAIATRTLVSGPKGSGKEHVARTIHASRCKGLSDENSAGKDDARLPAIMPMDCAVIDAGQLGTIVTAFVQQCAEVEAFQTPTLLLLNVDRLDPVAQDELQGFLAIQEIGLRTIGTSAASHTELLANEEYRNDLANLLATFEIELPAVCERIDDIPLLVQYFIEKQNSKGGMQRSGFSPAALEQCVAYPWPRNVNEIEKVVAQCFANAAGCTINVDELPAQIRLGMDAVLYPAETQDPINLDQVLMDHERELISKTLEATKQNKAEAARRLGMNRAKLLRRISHLGLE